MLAGSSVVNDEHLRSIFFGDYMFPEADAKIYDEVLIVTFVENKFPEANATIYYEFLIVSNDTDDINAFVF